MNEIFTRRQAEIPQKKGKFPQQTTAILHMSNWLPETKNYKLKPSNLKGEKRKIRLA